MLRNVAAIAHGHVGDMARGFRQVWAAWNRFFSHLKETKWRSNHKRDNIYQTLAKNLVSSPLISEIPISYFLKMLIKNRFHFFLKTYEIHMEYTDFLQDLPIARLANALRI